MKECLVKAFVEAVRQQKKCAILYQNPDLTEAERRVIRNKYATINNDFILPLSNMLEKFKVDTYSIEKRIYTEE